MNNVIKTRLIGFDLVVASIMRGEDALSIAYNLAGQRVQAQYKTKENGTLAHRLDNYSYSADGYLIDTTIDTNPTDTIPGTRRSRGQTALGRRVSAYTEYNDELHTGNHLRQGQPHRTDHKYRWPGEHGMWFWDRPV